MFTLTRRQFVNLCGMVPIAGLTARPAIAQNATAISRSLKISIEKPGGHIHTFKTDDPNAVTVHVIEAPKGVIVIDSGSGDEWSSEIRSFIDALEQPVAAVLISHDHPDHTSGLAAFSGLPIFTTQGIIDNGKVAPWGVPSNWGEVNVIEPGTLDLAGVQVIVRKFNDAEAQEQIVLEIPELDTTIVQDLVYNNTFIYPGYDRAGRLEVLEALRKDVSTTTLLVGHGYPAHTAELGAQIDFIHDYDTLVAVSDGPVG